MCRPMWSFLLMYGSHDMRHIGFPQVDGGQRDPWEMGRHMTCLLKSLIPSTSMPEVAELGSCLIFLPFKLKSLT